VEALTVLRLETAPGVFHHVAAPAALQPQLHHGKFRNFKEVQRSRANHLDGDAGRVL
jgi:hypothetical protein